MNIAKYAALYGFSSYLIGRVVNSVIATDSQVNGLKPTCIYHAIFKGSDICSPNSGLAKYCCEPLTPTSSIDQILLGMLVTGVIFSTLFALSFIGKETFPEPIWIKAPGVVPPDLTNRATPSTNRNRAGGKADATSPTTSVEELLKMAGDTNALTTFTAAQASGNRDAFDIIAASAVTTSDSNSHNNFFALEAFSKGNKIVDSALTQQVIKGKPVYAREEEFETRSSDGSITKGTMQVVQTLHGITYHSRETTTYNGSSIA